ncbi:hypothetical protein CPB84DRAFT_1804662 [Gymnopilus junonius]|uniref:Uncharacterized protein n=1 Tax=Gymnopilus junonius TaxID=109634 RepID=A0A9P5N6P3_GYMJU|nr:hypothetical protein CPB84DRAFT_1804662 [Gymnopilus junonius]
MKLSFATTLISLMLATTALSQNIAIGFPKDGASVTPGSNITVEFDRPVRLIHSSKGSIPNPHTL